MTHAVYAHGLQVILCQQQQPLAIDIVVVEHICILGHVTVAMTFDTQIANINYMWTL